MFQKEMWWANQSDSLPPTPSPKKTTTTTNTTTTLGAVPHLPTHPKLITTTNNRYNLQICSAHGCMSSPMNKLDKEAGIRVTSNWLEGKGEANNFLIV
jgi:hypothetical protein